MDITVKGNEMYIDNKSNSISLTTKNGVVVEQTDEDMEISTTPPTIGIELPKEVAGKSWIKDVYVNGQSVIDENGIAQIQIPDTSEFITKSVNDLINYYNKEEINELAMSIQTVNIVVVDTLPTIGKSNVIYFVKKDGSENDIYDEWIYINNKWEHIGSTQVDLTGYATEQWVNNKLEDYVPAEEFTSILQLYLNNYYNKKEIDTKLEEKANIVTYNKNFNIFEENGEVKAYTNTGYIIDDNYISYQDITEIDNVNQNKICYTDDEVVIIYDGTNQIRRSENGIDFEIITLPRICKDMVYNSNSKRIYGLSDNGYIIYSDDNGKTWIEVTKNWFNNVDYLFLANSYTGGFAMANLAEKRLSTITESNFSQNSYITSTITPNFACLLNTSQFIWCNGTGAFKYGAGSKEGNFPSAPTGTINLLKNVNEKVIVGYKNSNRLAILNKNTVSGSSWVEYPLPDTCTVNDIIYNPNDETYYILTNINSYYKTKDFINFESIDKNGLRANEGYFTLMGIQATSSEKNKLFLAPTRTKIENKLQEHDRALNKERWAGNGLEVDGEKINVVGSEAIGVNANKVYLVANSVDYTYLSPEISKNIRAYNQDPILISPYDLENWFWENYMDSDTYFSFIFTEDGSFYDFMSYEVEYTVQKGELGYIYVDEYETKYTKRMNLKKIFEAIMN